MVLLGLSTISGLFIIGRHNYLLFHTLVELGAVAVAWSVFLLIWNARCLKTPPAFVLLGIGYALVGALDLLHALAYKDMGVFPETGADLATQLWIAARFIETSAMLLFPLCFIVGGLVQWGVYALIAGTFIMIGGIFAWDLFPECFNAKTGLTPFKIASEYIVIGALSVSAILTHRKRNSIDKNVALYLTVAILVMILSEFCFTLYTSPFGLANMIGHLFKVISFILIYRALIMESLERPMETLAHGLSEEIERYSRVIETAVDGFWIVDMQGRICDANASAEQMMGFSRDTLLSMQINDIEANESAGETAWHMKKVVEKGYALFETKHRHQDGSILDVEVSCSFLPYDNGRFIVFVRDISERKQLAANLAAEHMALEAIFNASPDILVLKDNNSVYQRANPTFCTFIGKDSGHIIGRTDYELFPEEDARQYVLGDAAVLKTGIQQNEEWLVMGQTGQRWLQVIKTAVRDTSGRSLGILCTGRDVSEHHRLNNLLLDTIQKEQEKLAQELHDGLCQDLKSLEIEAALLEDMAANRDENTQSFSAAIGRKANLAVRKAYAIAGGRLPLGLNAENFSAALSELVENTQKSATNQVSGSIRTDLTPCDDKQAYHLYRIAQEGIKNAMQHSKASKIELIWRKENNLMLLSIRDNGIGIGSKKAETPRGMGLQVMLSRAQAIGANLTIPALEKSGTEILVRLRDE